MSDQASIPPARARHVRESRSQQDSTGLRTPAAAVAVNHHGALSPRLQLAEARLDLAQRHQRRSLDVRLLELVGLAHVEEQERLSPLGDPLHLGGGELSHRRLFRPAHPAESLVVDQLGDGGPLAADRTARILGEAELVELHLQGVEVEEASDQRLADPGEQLQRLGRLDHRDEAGEHAEHAALGAVGHRARRRRLGEEAAVAGPAPRVEDRGLAVEAEDRAVDVRLPEQHAGVVREVAGREVVGAVHDHVVVAEDRRGVLRAQALLVDRDARRPDSSPRSARAPPRPWAARRRRSRRGPGAAGSRGRRRRSRRARAADARGGQVLRQRAAETAGADQEDAALQQLALPFDAELGKGQMAAVALELFRAQKAEREEAISRPYQMNRLAEPSGPPFGELQVFASFLCGGITTTL